MNKLKLSIWAVAGLVAAVATPAAAVPPPAPPPDFLASWQAIEHLAPFQGRWTGTEVSHSRWGDSSSRVYRVVKRLGGRDVLLLEAGSYNPASVGVAEEFDVISFDVKSRQYRAYLPGYRLFTNDNSTSQLVRLEQPDAQTIVWSAKLDDGGQRRTTVVVTPQNWRERVEHIAVDGSINVLSEMELTRDSSAGS